MRFLTAQLAGVSVVFAPVSALSQETIPNITIHHRYDNTPSSNGWQIKVDSEPSECKVGPYNLNFSFYHVTIINQSENGKQVDSRVNQAVEDVNAALKNVCGRRSLNSLGQYGELVLKRRVDVSILCNEKAAIAGNQQDLTRMFAYLSENVKTNKTIAALAEYGLKRDDFISVGRNMNGRIFDQGAKSYSVSSGSETIISSIESSKTPTLIAGTEAADDEGSSNEISFHRADKDGAKDLAEEVSIKAVKKPLLDFIALQYGKYFDHAAEDWYIDLSARSECSK